MTTTTVQSAKDVEQGQLAEVRQRRYVVTDVRRSAAPSGAHPAAGSPYHLVSLTSIEDDGLGEELQVVWELEPGARVFEKMALPEPSGFDPPARLDAFLDAVRWGAASVADTKLIQAPFRSGIEIEPYQLDPVVRAVQMPRVNLLVADDVGLGKTIEAGMVALELILRHRTRRILIVCPASLQIQWQRQMHDKFGLEFRIIDSAMLRELRRSRGLRANPWTHFPRLITSVDFLKRERPLRLFREVLPAAGEAAYPRRFDLLIVDEAHNAAPSGRGKYAQDSLRTDAIRTIAPHFEHKLFLTATPHNGYPESFSALLELLDDQRFARGVKPDRKQLEVVMVRRLKSEIKNWDGTPRFPKRTPLAIEVQYTDDERRVHKLLQDYTRLRLEASSESTERFASEFVLKLLKKRLFSSPQAFLDTLVKHEQTIRASRQKTQVKKPSTRLLQLEFDRIDEDYADDEEREKSTEEAIEVASEALGSVSPEQLSLLAEMKKWAERATAVLDCKAKCLVAWLEEHIRPNGNWGQQRVIIFTEYRSTQKWLDNLLAARGFAAGEHLMMLHGNMASDERERVKAAFQFDPAESPVRILLATDAASEGIDLQNHCHRLIHYEIPWNPNRMEQRNGRIDRHGQRAKEVLVYHFVGKGFDEAVSGTKKASELEADLEFLMRAALKVNTIREDLGKVGPVIAQQVEEAMLGMRTVLDTHAAERENESVKRLLKFERDLKQQIERLVSQLQETRQELRLEPENVRSVVEIALELAGQPALQPVSGFPGAFHLPEFREPSWAPCLEGLYHPHTNQRRPVVFDPALAQGRDDVVLAHLNHRLVQMCLRLLRAEVWAPAGNRKIHRVDAPLTA